MKKLSIFIALFIGALSVKAQNIQLHYDMGEGRQYFTSTVEMFKLDKWGSTFFFIDMDYGANDFDGVSQAYWEVARSFKISKDCAFEPRVEYNGGFFALQDQVDKSKYSAAPINNAFLVGGQYTWASGDFSKIFTLSLNYKYIEDKNDASFQVTGVWNLNFFNKKFSMTGFADFWREDVTTFDDNGGMHDKKYVFMTEPQFWYNVNSNLALGSEIEMSTNFAAHDGFMVNPTVAVKWTF
ncbi:DUF5020 family protein [Halosquirtibacter laminarini]|uniref:DUF5020 family protein n=1 Tax=Halosquirtibacter laminarini TaxID=3374600 RepID=A0AC61NKE0_9BACT|nr:DUF5020 family protein [Prolixibacteraceae bacterium]